MSFLIQEIIGPTLRNFAQSSKSCKFTADGFVLEPKFGKITISLPNFVNAECIEMYIKRLSGNGKVEIKIADDIQTISVHSKISESVFLSAGQLIDIFRPADSTGEICIIGINVYSDKWEGDILANNWKSIISRCGECSCIRIIGDRLFAAEGAFISKDEVIESIITSPPNMAYRESGKIRFRGACEIRALNIIQNAPIVKQTFDLYPERDAPVPIIPEIPIVIPSKVVLPIKTELLTQETRKPQMFIYDSNSVNEFNPITKPNNKFADFRKSNGQNFLVLRPTGTFSVPISTVLPNTEYVIVVSAQRLSGNGRLSAGFKMDGEVNFISYDSTIVSNKVEEFYIRVNSGTPSGVRNLNVAMLADSSGEIVVTRIRVMVGHYKQGLITDSTNTISFPVDISTGSKRFVVVIPSYNNEKWCQKNIESVLDQRYDKYRAIFIDDASSDSTLEIVNRIVNASPRGNKITVIHNSERKGALANLYAAIHSCDDDEIILTLDGDDWFPHELVINALEAVYSTGNVWMTYGQYQNFPGGDRGIATPYSANVIDNNIFRQSPWGASHLRTFYAWLFKNISQHDLFYKGNFMAMTWDLAMMFPMLEMAGHRSKFIPDILYTYNLDNPINDHKVNVRLQQDLDRYVRHLPKYTRLSKPVLHKRLSVGLMLIATGKYHTFVQGLISSADNYFLNRSECDVTYYVFTDRNIAIKSNRSVVQIPIEHRQFPFASMDRFKHFVNASSKLEKEDYLYYVDVDCLFVDQVSTEILGSLVGVRHCGFTNTIGPYENKPNSVFYVDPAGTLKYQHYFGGGFSGGRRSNYLKLSRWCNSMIDQDVAKGIIPLWHDETALNRYFLDNQPDVVLSPSYHYPQSNVDYYKKIWAPETFKPKILLLDKNHRDIRV